MMREPPGEPSTMKILPSLVTKDGDPVQTVAQAMAEFKRLQTQRSDNTLPMLASLLADKVTHAVLDVW